MILGFFASVREFSTDTISELGLMSSGSFQPLLHHSYIITMRVWTAE
jgi:hypothetical protein